MYTSLSAGLFFIRKFSVYHCTTLSRSSQEKFLFFLIENVIENNSTNMLTYISCGLKEAAAA